MQNACLVLPRGVTKIVRHCLHYDGLDGVALKWDISINDQVNCLLLTYPRYWDASFEAISWYELNQSSKQPRLPCTR